MFNGTRIAKNNIRVETYGTVDELNSVLGIVSSFLPESKEYAKDMREMIIIIQHDLFEIGAILANPDAKDSDLFSTHLEKHTLTIENYIDAMTAQLPPLTNFILPGGGHTGAFFQLARTVSRRCERRIVSLNKEEEVPSAILIYINRLSDLFHTMSRFSNFKEGKEETVWKKRGM